MKEYYVARRAGWESFSLGGDAQLVVRSVLLFGQFAEEPDFVLARRFPLVVRLERRFEVRLDVDVEGLGLELRVRWVVHTWHRFS